MEKPNHDHFCDHCGEPATRNIQSQFHEYEIIQENGDFVHKDQWEGDTNAFLCDKEECADQF